MNITLLGHHFLQLAAEEQGVAVVPIEGMNENKLRELRTDAAKQEYRPAISTTITEVKQNFSCCNEFELGSLWKDVAFTIGAQLMSEYSRTGQSSMIDGPLFFTDLSLQKYPATDPSVRFGISPHRDQSAFINLVAILLISGPSSFCVCSDKSGRGASDVMARPGDLILMRGGGYGGGKLSRPYHFVGPIYDPYGRLTFGMRQLTSDVAEAAKVHSILAHEEPVA